MGEKFETEVKNLTADKTGENLVQQAINAENWNDGNDVDNLKEFSDKLHKAGLLPKDITILNAGTEDGKIPNGGSLLITDSTGQEYSAKIENNKLTYTRPDGQIAIDVGTGQETRTFTNNGITFTETRPHPGEGNITSTYTTPDGTIHTDIMNPDRSFIDQVSTRMGAPGSGTRTDTHTHFISSNGTDLGPATVNVTGIDDAHPQGQQRTILRDGQPAISETLGPNGQVTHSELALNDGTPLGAALKPPTDQNQLEQWNMNLTQRPGEGPYQAIERQYGTILSPVEINKLARGVFESGKFQDGQGNVLSTEALQAAVTKDASLLEILQKIHSAQV